MWYVFSSLSAGYPPIEGATILEKRRYVRSHLDHLRTLLMYEPRGHADMYGALLVDSDLPEVDMAVLFMHNEGKGQSRASIHTACLCLCNERLKLCYWQLNCSLSHRSYVSKCEYTRCCTHWCQPYSIPRLSLRANENILYYKRWKAGRGLGTRLHWCHGQVI